MTVVGKQLRFVTGYDFFLDVGFSICDLLYNANLTLISVMGYQLWYVASWYQAHVNNILIFRLHYKHLIAIKNIYIYQHLNKSIFVQVHRPHYFMHLYCITSLCLASICIDVFCLTSPCMAYMAWQCIVLYCRDIIMVSCFKVMHGLSMQVDYIVLRMFHRIYFTLG